MSVHIIPGTGFNSNSFILLGEDPILVDTGTGSNITALKGKISKVIDIDSLHTIILTHRHFDHIGGASKLSKDISAKVFIHELDAQPVRSGDPLGTEASMTGLEISPVEVDELKGGEVFSTGANKYEVLHTPGHTIGGFSLFDRDERSLISGDTVFAEGVGRWDLRTGDHAALVLSVKKLRSLDPINLYPGHGPCAEGDAAEHLAEALKYLEGS